MAKTPDRSPLLPCCADELRYEVEKKRAGKVREGELRVGVLVHYQYHYGLPSAIFGYLYKMARARLKQGVETMSETVQDIVKPNS